MTFYCDVERARAKKMPLGEAICWFVIGLAAIWLLYILGEAAMAGRLR